MNQELEKFCKNIYYKFNNINFLLEAITHPSLSKEKKSKPNYQRLEFLGDKVLGLIISEFLMEKYPQEMEGDLSKRHAALVSGDTLSKIALKINLNEILQVSKGEENLGGKNNKRNLENSLEALIGAIYLDSNFELAKNFVMRFWQDHLQENVEPPKDPVSELQELIQLKSKKLPQYLTRKIGGSDHDPIFVSSVNIEYLNKEFSAKGKSKKEAQKKVSQDVLAFIKEF